MHSPVECKVNMNYVCIGNQNRTVKRGMVGGIYLLTYLTGGIMVYTVDRVE